MNRFGTLFVVAETLGPELHKAGLRQPDVLE
jgi:hypothetical protein